MKKQKNVWELSFAKIKKLRKEIVLNSLFVRDYQNSLGLDPNQVMCYFDAYFEFLLDNVKLVRGQGKSLPSDMARIISAIRLDTWKNLKYFHQNYDFL